MLDVVTFVATLGVRRNHIDLPEWDLAFQDMGFVPNLAPLDLVGLT